MTTEPKSRTRPPYLRARIAFWELISPGSVRAAQLRWRARNAAQRRACPCGEPGTVLRADYGNTGNVPVEWWYCTDHARVPLTTPWMTHAGRGVPMVQDAEGAWVTLPSPDRNET